MAATRMTKCIGCDGKGRYRAVCPTCNGRGFHAGRHGQVVTCRPCAGAGRVDQVCGRCGGYGTR